MVHMENRPVDDSFDNQANLLLGKVNMRIKVRVIHLWKVHAFLKPSEYSSLEFVWVDEKGGKIHASIRKQLVNVFESKVEEGEVYESKIVALIHSSKPHIYYSTVFFWCIGKSISLNETKFHKSYILDETKVFETTQTSGKKITAIKA